LICGVTRALAVMDVGAHVEPPSADERTRETLDKEF
jgi:hypothetical protein